MFGEDPKRPFKAGFGKPGFNKENRSFSRSAGDDSRTDKKTYNSDRSFGEKKSFNSERSFNPDNKRSDGKSFGEKKSFGSRSSFGDSRSEGRSFGNDRPQGDRKPYGSRPTGDDNRSERKPYGSRSTDSDNKGERKPYGDRPQGERKPYGSRSNDSDNKGERKPYGDKSQGDRKPYGSRSNDGDNKGERRSYGDKPQGERKLYSSRSNDGDNKGERKPYGNSERSGAERSAAPKRFNDKPFKSRSSADDSGSFERPKYKSDDRQWSSEERLKSNNRSKRPSVAKDDDGTIRLNRYIANAGICSRRKADELISAGVVSVNGEAVTELGLKIDPYKDVIRYNGETLKREKMVYVLLNKPKDYITTTEDPQERKTVMSLVEKASRERIYPVGRLDRNTTGLLLMTNDGDLAEKLSHPRNNVTKIYQVELNRNLSQGDLNKITFGLELEDGLIKPDQVTYVAGGAKNEIGIQIHSGKNRIVRRIFESLGYEVVKLDRVVYSHLTKKDLPRGRWRYLEEKEIIQLKHLIKS
ncbi:pseudouridine synthase [Daejeonella oryzae]